MLRRLAVRWHGNAMHVGAQGGTLTSRVLARGRSLDGDCFARSALALMGVRHEGHAGLLHRQRLRGQLADWLLARRDSEAWQRTVVLHGESGLAHDIAAQEAARALDVAMAPPASAGRCDVDSPISDQPHAACVRDIGSTVAAPGNGSGSSL